MLTVSIYPWVKRWTYPRQRDIFGFTVTSISTLPNLMGELTRFYVELIEETIHLKNTIVVTYKFTFYSFIFFNLEYGSIFYFFNFVWRGGGLRSSYNTKL